MNEIEFIWEPKESDLGKHFSALLEFYRQEGHLKIPEKWPQYPGLFNWTHKIREAKKKGLIQNVLSADQISTLDSIGFVWSPNDKLWNDRYLELVAFKSKHGHCDVRERDDFNLAVWVTETRKNRKRRGMSQERIDQLDALGFVWDTRSKDWDDMFNDLCAYKDRYGNCDVRLNSAENQDLAEWVTIQRKSKKSGKISIERQSKLNAIGFVFDPFSASWDEWFLMLADYGVKNGNCNVSQKWKENPALGKWVSDQRKKWRDGNKLSSEQIRRLDELGMVWQPRRGGLP